MISMVPCSRDWTRYRTCAEKLKLEAVIYLMGIEPYKHWEDLPEGSMENDRLLVQNIEKTV